jgi:hypothetical protein
MPNWCNNHIVLQHDDPAMIKRAYDALERGEFLSEFIPCPAELLDERTGSFGGPDADVKDQLRKDLVEKYGYSGWYDWQVNNWGTKWDTGEQGNNDINPNDPGMLTAGFDTAWSPPVSAYEKLSDLGFRVHAMYYEPGMAYAGIWSTEDGDEEFNLGGMDSAQAAADLPQELDECFGISEQMAEYEAENEEEELTEWLKDGIDKTSQLIEIKEDILVK